MATMKMTGCMKIVAKMPDADQDTLLARLDQYQGDGIPAAQAQMMAARDTLAEIQAEREQLYSAIAEQHPDLLTVEEPAKAQAEERAQLKSATGNDGSFDLEDGDISSSEQRKGINVRSDGENRYADLIVDGEKTMESRDTDSLRPYVGKTIGIIRTGEGPAKLIGSAKIGEPIKVSTRQFRSLESEHLVPAGSAFDIKPGSTKFLYPITEANRFDTERDVDSRGIVAREVAFSEARTDTPAFKRWFGDSKAVVAVNAETGKPVGSSKEPKKLVPQVMYHTTRNDFSTFEIGRITTNSGTFGSWDTSRAAVFVTPELDASQTYGTQGGEFSEGANVMPLYIRAENPLDLTSGVSEEAEQKLLDAGMSQGFINNGLGNWSMFDDEDGRAVVETIKKAGYDSVIFNDQNPDTGDSFEAWALFTPEQIKSAIGNNGNFDPTNPNITKSTQRAPQRERKNIYGEKMLSSWTTPDSTKMDDVLYVMQDKLIDTKRVVDAIKEAAGGIADRWNPYLKEELFHGRTAKQTQDFLMEELRPLMQEMQARNVSVADFEKYLHNRHAEERNKQIAKINEKMPDGGSGIKTAEARDYLAGLDAAKKRAYESLAKRIDSINAGTRKVLVDSGLETQETIDTWERTYSQYVPLFREDMDFGMGGGSQGTGQGYNVKGGSSKRATGSSRGVVDILANVAMQRERAIVRGQKNRVAESLYGLAVSQPNTEFYLAVNPDAIKDTGKLVDELISMGLNPLDARNIVEEPKQSYIDPRTGLVNQRINPLLRSSDNVLSVRVNGTERYVFFNANEERGQRMVSALKNLDADQLGRVMGITATVTRYFASINTQYNPIFGVINFLRDVQGAALNLTTTPLADSKKQVMADALPALRGIYADTRAERKGKARPTGTWAKLWEEFQEQGGATGFRDQFSKSAERAEALEKELKRIGEGKVKQAGRAVFDWLSDYNQTMENAVRLAAYKAALDKGISVEQSASLAKNLTVNFNRKGQVATQAGALYAFFNASVQGTARLTETLTGPVGKKIVAGGLLLGTAQALLLAAAGFDEDEPADFVKERNLIIPTGDGKYLQLPMPLGFNVIPNTSRVITEWAMSGFKETPERIGQITGAFLEMFNPIGNAGWSVQTLAPTLVDPLVALSENRDYTGKKIAKPDMSSLDPTPGYTRAKDTASWFSKQLSYYLNLASGGTKYQPGLMSPTPDQIDYLIGQATGGVGREILKADQAVRSTVTGEELPTYKIPLVGRFIGNTKESAAEANRFYQNITRLNQHENEIKGRRKNGEDVADYRRENPEARLTVYANKVERDLADMRQQKRRLIEQDASKERVKLIETRMNAKMKQLNDRVRSLRDQEPAEAD